MSGRVQSSTSTTSNNAPQPALIPVEVQMAQVSLNSSKSLTPGPIANSFDQIAGGATENSYWSWQATLTDKVLSNKDIQEAATKLKGKEKNLEGVLKEQGTLIQAWVLAMGEGAGKISLGDIQQRLRDISGNDRTMLENIARRVAEMGTMASKFEDEVQDMQRKLSKPEEITDTEDLINDIVFVLRKINEKYERVPYSASHRHQAAFDDDVRIRIEDAGVNAWNKGDHPSKIMRYLTGDLGWGRTGSVGVNVNRLKNIMNGEVFDVGEVFAKRAFQNPNTTAYLDPLKSELIHPAIQGDMKKQLQEFAVKITKESHSKLTIKGLPQISDPYSATISYKDKTFEPEDNTFNMQRAYQTMILLNDAIAATPPNEEPSKKLVQALQVHASLYRILAAKSSFQSWILDGGSEQIQVNDLAADEATRNAHAEIDGLSQQLTGIRGIYEKEIGAEKQALTKAILEDPAITGFILDKTPQGGILDAPQNLLSARLILAVTGNVFNNVFNDGVNDLADDGQLAERNRTITEGSLAAKTAFEAIRDGLLKTRTDVLAQQKKAVDSIMEKNAQELGTALEGLA